MRLATGHPRTHAALGAALLLALAACSSRGPASAAGPGPGSQVDTPGEAGEPPGAAPAPAEPASARVQVTVVSADLHGRMANGEHWDGERATGKALAPLERYFARHPELADTIPTVGVPVDDSERAERARSSPAADPMVLVEVGDAVFRSPVLPRSFHPLWNFSFRFVYGDPARVAAHGGVATGATMRIHVVDYDGPRRVDAMGTTVLAVDRLLEAPVHTLGPFGSVDKLTVQVRVEDMDPNLDPMDPDMHGDAGASDSVRLAVPGKPSWTDTGVEVIAGQRLWIRAADEVCTSPDSEAHCSGPEGQRAPHSYNLAGFETLGHGALVAAIGDTRFAVRRELRLVAPASGRLRLGINDRDADNNSGSYAAHIVTYAVP